MSSTTEKQEIEYKAILSHYGVNTNASNVTLSTGNWVGVTMDDIHDAIIDVGVDLDQHREYYYRVARDKLGQRYRKKYGQGKIKREHYQLIEDFDTDEMQDSYLAVEDGINFQLEYNLTDEEMDVVMLKYQKISYRHSKYTYYEYHKLLESIRTKIQSVK